jgi:RNA recognition motif-containing protein
MNIIVLNLPRDITSNALAELFKPHGNIVSCEIMLDKVTGTSKGFGFVEMKTVAEGKAAISKLHNTKVSTNRIRVKAAEGKK